MKYFFFNFDSKSIAEGYTVIFDCWEKLHPQELSRELKEFHTYNEQNKKTVYIYPEVDDRNSGDLKSELSDIANKEVGDIVLLPFTHEGIREDGKETLIADLFENGILEIVTSRNAVLESDGSYHYILPSEKHSPFFIRTGNILSNSEEVNFISLKILSLIKEKKIHQITCDTSSILPIPYSINHLLGLFGKAYSVPFDSFSSYGSVDEYNFLPRTLVLISASNSGRLLRKIKLKQQDIDFITVLYNGEDPGQGTLLNLKPHLSNILSIPEYKQYEGLKEECEYCKQNSTPVVVRGDQFIPSRILIQRVLLSKQSVPAWIKSTNNLISCGAIAAYRQEDLISKKREIFIDLEKIFDNNSSFGQEFNKYLRNSIASATSVIIHLPDKSSKFIAEKIRDRIAEQGIKANVIDSTKIKEIDKAEQHTFLVVAACITTGNKLNSISRDLRDFDNSSIHYLAIISRLSDSSRSETLRKNLEYRSNSSSNVNRFSSIIDCYLGDYHCNLYNEADKPSWDGELSFWKARKKKSNDPYINQRIQELENKNGLVDNLFLPKPTEDRNEKLKLRKNFAFHKIEGHSLNLLTQCDLYLIIAGIFHYLRNPKYIKNESRQNGNEKFLVQHEHVKTIIDPVCFKRYNDGIIQAAILRVSTNSELNYAVSDRDSLEMLETLKDIFKTPDDANLSEGLLEFLFAIAIKKLRLKPYHLRNFLEFIVSKYSHITLVKVLEEACRELLPPEVAAGQDIPPTK